MSSKESTKMVKAISLAYKFLHQLLISPYPSTAGKKTPVSSSGSRVHFRVEEYSSGSSKKLFKRSTFCCREQPPYYSTQIWFPHINTWNKQICHNISIMFSALFFTSWVSSNAFYSRHFFFCTISFCRSKMFFSDWRIGSTYCSSWLTNV